ncbi:hypothetical protein ACFVH9_08675 [Streptomyces hirsutus]|uniref:hypothetical protein n=1 Tax=Streptomyces hirsutus TaxID=35620 RepID=UPI003630F35D
MNTLVDHQAAAWRLELQPGVEGLVKVYASKQGGEAVARGIRNGTIAAYGPAGTFDAVAAMHSTGTAVWARYVKGLDLPPLPETMTVSVPDYGPQAGYEGVWVVEVEIFARCQLCGCLRGPVLKDTFIRDGARHVRDTWTNVCGHKDNYQTVLEEAQRRKDRAGYRLRQHVAIKGVQGGKFTAAVGVIAEGIAETQWLSAKKAAHLVEDAGHGKAADLIWEFIRSNRSKTPSARAAALYLMQRDTEALAAADRNQTTGVKK